MLGRGHILSLKWAIVNRANAAYHVLVYRNGRLIYSATLESFVEHTASRCEHIELSNISNLQKVLERRTDPRSSFWVRCTGDKRHCCTMPPGGDCSNKFLVRERWASSSLSRHLVHGAVNTYRQEVAQMCGKSGLKRSYAST